MSSRQLCFSVLHFLCTFANAAKGATTHYTFNLTWVWVAPDNQVFRPVIGVNDAFPLPTIMAARGDTVELAVINPLGNQSASIHFHGLFMNGSSHMDGTSYVSQCAIEPGTSFTYKFKVQQGGTYWYHSHTESQYPDGLRGMLIVDDPDSPYRAKYEDEIVLSLSDWYHDQTPSLLSTYGAGGHMIPHDPIPDAALMNDTQELNVPVKTGTTYYLRLANIGALASQYFWTEGHSMTIIEVDGVYTQPNEAQMLYIATGQRYGVLVTTRSDSGQNFPIVARLDRGDIETPGCLQYDENQPCPKLEAVQDLNLFDDMELVPYDQMPRLTKIDRTIPLSIRINTRNGLVHWTFNSTDYFHPEVPTLFNALVGTTDANDPSHYGAGSIPLVAQRNEVVEFLLTNIHMEHPVHLHGHNFRVLRQAVSDEQDGAAAAVPMRRDTMTIKGHETLSLRFRADNPGVWLFHYHMEWHAHSGLSATLIEAPLDLQHRLSLSDKHELGPNKTCSGKVSQMSTPEIPFLPSPSFDESVIGQGQGHAGEGEDPEILEELFKPAVQQSGYDIAILALAGMCIFMGLVMIIWLRGGFSLKTESGFQYVPLQS